MKIYRTIDLDQYADEILASVKRFCQKSEQTLRSKF